MSKEYLEAFNRIKNLLVCVDYEKDIVKSVNEIVPKSCDKVEQALERLESIDNADYSDALVYIEDLRIENDALIAVKDTTGYDADTQRIYVGRLKDKEKEINTIKQYILKAQEQEKENTELKRVLEIIKEKPTQSRVAIAYLVTSINPTYEDYCLIVKEKDLLSKEEFDLLMRYMR